MVSAHAWQVWADAILLVADVKRAEKSYLPKTRMRSILYLIDFAFKKIIKSYY